MGSRHTRLRRQDRAGSAGPARVWPWTATIVVVGLLLAAAAVAATEAAHRSSERRLLHTQTKQAAALIGSTVTSLAAPIASAGQLAALTDGDPAEFRSFMAEHTGPGAAFVTAALWRVGSPTPVATVGLPALLPPARLQALLDKAGRVSTFAVTQVDAPATRIAYASAARRDRRYVVYAERAIPPDRQVPVERDSAFSELRFATYLGPTTVPQQLATTNVAPSTLPLTGRTATERIPFGDTVITLVASARGDLGGGLGASLPLVGLLVGLVATAGTALATGRLVAHRRSAEADGATIADLYAQLDLAFREQRDIATTLQQALLPVNDLALPGLDVACRYVVGSVGVDVGGDWYSLVELDEGRFAFAVGDVSGRGVAAAALMARLQFTMRAFLSEGHAPERVLAACAQHIDLERDGHFATALVGVCDMRTSTVTLASAGHPPPLVTASGGATYAPVQPGLPLGLGRDAYQRAVVDLPSGAMLMAYTDGLIERRGESLDDGLRRLADVAAAARDRGDIGSWADAVVDRLSHEGTEDDIAVLAFRLAPPAQGGAEPPADPRLT